MCTDDPSIFSRNINFTGNYSSVLLCKIPEIKKGKLIEACRMHKHRKLLEKQS